MHETAWERIRGHAEFAARGHADSVTCWSAASAGITQIILPPPCRMFHQPHARTNSTNWPTIDWHVWYDRFLVARKRHQILLVNDKDWGMANWEFDELVADEENDGQWQPCSRLTACA